MDLLTKFGGNNGNLGAIKGCPVPVTIAASQWTKMEELIIQQSDELDKQDGWVDDETMMRMLQINSKKTLSNYVCDGTIPNEAVRTAVNGTRSYYWKKIMGHE